MPLKTCRESKKKKCILILKEDISQVNTTYKSSNLGVLPIGIPLGSGQGMLPASIRSKLPVPEGIY